MKNTNDNYEWMMSTQDKLFWAIAHNNFWMVSGLISRGLDLTTTNTKGVNPVEYAVKLGRNKMAEFLKSKGGEYNARP